MSNTCNILLQTGGKIIKQAADGFLLLANCVADAIAPNGGARQEYQPTHYELRHRKDIERKFEEAKLDLKATQIKIDNLEFKRLHDLADQALQIELLQLLAQQHQLMQLINQLQQQKLRALNDDEEILMLLVAGQFNA